MKRLFLIALSIVFTATGLNAQTIERQICNNRLDVVVNNAMIEEDDVVIDMDIHIPAATFDDATYIKFAPYLASEDGETVQKLEVLDVMSPAKKAYLDYYYMGVTTCGTCCPNRVVVDPTVDQIVSYTVRVPWQTWMNPAKLMCKTTLCLEPCGSEFLGDDFICNIPFCTEPLAINPVWAYPEFDQHGRIVGPEYTDEPSIYIKDLAVRHEHTRIYFPVNVTRNVKTYFENADAMALLQTINEGDFEVLDITIEGWASPEATVAYNQGLSDRRAKTMKTLVAQNYNFPEEVYNVKGDGEYWATVIDAIENSQEATIADNRDALKAAVANNADLDKREAAIKAVAKGAPYRYLFQTLYPRARFSDVDVAYKVREYSPEEVLAVMYEHPENICVGEYYRTLLTLDKYSDKWVEVLFKALETYPDCPELNYLAGEYYYNVPDYHKTVQYLSKATSTISEAINDNGCVDVKTNFADRAERNFKKAEKQDVEEATENLEVVKALNFNNTYFKGENY